MTIYYSDRFKRLAIQRLLLRHLQPGYSRHLWQIEIIIFVLVSRAAQKARIILAETLLLTAGKTIDPLRCATRSVMGMAMSRIGGCRWRKLGLLFTV
jgi:hypothetical protein